MRSIKSGMTGLFNWRVQVCRRRRLLPALIFRRLVSLRSPGIGRGRIGRPDHRERNADIVEQVKAGISPSDVAVRFGLSVKRICQIAGIGRGRAARPDHRERNKVIRACIADGASQAAVARMFGLSVKRISQITGQRAGRFLSRRRREQMVNFSDYAGNFLKGTDLQGREHLVTIERSSRRRSATASSWSPTSSGGGRRCP